MDNRARAFRATLIKLGAFAVVMVLVFTGLVVVFSNYRSGKSTDYSALFTSASTMKSGAKVKIAGVEVGSVDGIGLDRDNQAKVDFNVDAKYRLPASVRALIRYENLTGDRYLELQQGVGDPDELLTAGGQIPITQTEPALDLDKLLGGFKPLLRTLDADEVNELSGSLVAIFQGQGDHLNQLLSDTADFTNSIADRDELIGSVIDNLNATLGTLEADKEGFDTSIDTLAQLVSGLTEQKETIGRSLEETSKVTNNLADLLVTTRSDIKTTVGNLGKTSEEILKAEPYVRSLIQRLPEDYKTLSNLGSYGAWLQLWLCRIRIRLDGPGDSIIWYNAVDVTEESSNPGSRCLPR